MMPDRHQGIFQPPLKQAAADGAPVAAEKGDNSFFTSTDPHPGHATGDVSPAFCSFSKRKPHVLQLYSKIGIFSPTIYSNY